MDIKRGDVVITKRITGGHGRYLVLDIEADEAGYIPIFDLDELKEEGIPSMKHLGPYENLGPIGVLIP